MPEEGVKLTQSDKLLQGHEIVKLVKIFVQNGVNKIRFTGGEPLIRKDCVEIIGEISQIKGINKIGLTTNGINLAKRIKDLKVAGLNQLNISLDTLEPKKFEFITKRNGWSKVMNGIEASLDEGFSPVKVFIL
jgi:molybdenum cofactor biosynthesis enzyme MoaA